MSDHAPREMTVRVARYLTEPGLSATCVLSPELAMDRAVTNSTIRPIPVQTRRGSRSRRIRRLRAAVVRVGLLLLLPACSRSRPADQPISPSVEIDSVPPSTEREGTRPVSVFANGDWQMNVTSISVTNEVGADSAASDTTVVQLRGVLSIRVIPDSGTVLFSPDSAITRSTGRTRFPRAVIHRELPPYQLSVRRGLTVGGPSDASSRCSEAGGEQLVTGFLPLPLLLPHSTFAGDWIDSTQAQVCLGTTQTRLLTVTRYTAQPWSAGFQLDTLVLRRISHATADFTSTMDSLPIEVRVSSASTGQGVIPLLLPPVTSANMAVSFSDSVQAELSFRSPFREQRFTQRTIRTTVISRRDLRSAR